MPNRPVAAAVNLGTDVHGTSVYSCSSIRPGLSPSGLHVLDMRWRNKHSPGLAYPSISQSIKEREQETAEGGGGVWIDQLIGLIERKKKKVKAYKLAKPQSCV